jgi:hypothetical protein
LGNLQAFCGTHGGASFAHRLQINSNFKMHISPIVIYSLLSWAVKEVHTLFLLLDATTAMPIATTGFLIVQTLNYAKMIM